MEHNLRKQRNILYTKDRIAGPTNYEELCFTSKDETAQEKYVREISELAKVYVKNLLELQREV